MFRPWRCFTLKPVKKLTLMKKTALNAFSLLLCSVAAHAAPIFSEDFNSYTNGPLLGQGTPPWTITGTSVVNPISVSSGLVPLANTGQDVNAAFSSVYTGVDGTSLFYGATINLSAAGTGDYFLHLTPAAGNSTAFFGRVYAQASGAGFVLGYLETSGTGSAVNYGTGVLNFGSNYRVAVAYDFVAGTLNDTARLYVDPTDNVELNNTPYLSDTWTTVTAETNVFRTINFRQGGSSSSPTLTVDNLLVGTTFADVAQVPEPSVFALIGIGGLAFFLQRRARRN